MKKLLMILLLALLTININCGGGSGSGSSAKTSLVTVTIGGSGSGQATTGSFFKKFMPDMATEAIPSNVYKIVFTIAAPGMSTITKDVLVAGRAAITETFSIPNGNNWYFLIEAKDISGEVVLYRGSTTVNLYGRQVTLNINMTALDTASPTVISTSPANNTTGVPVTSVIIITFSETIDSSTFNSTTFTLRNNGNDVAGTIIVDGAVVTFTPLSTFSYSTTYTGTITNGVRDLAGNAMAVNYIWSFTTGAAPDTTPPTVIAVSPGDKATNVSIVSTLTATFSEAIDNSTINTSFTLSGSSPVSGTVNYAGTTATFTPSSNLAYDTTYTATITTGVKDLAGNAMAADYPWSFTTEAPPAPPAPPALIILPSSTTVNALTNPDGNVSDDLTFTISGGTPSYNVTSDNTTLIASPGAVAGNTFSVDPNSTCSGATVTLTATDSLGTTVTAAITVGHNAAYFRPLGSICENDNTCTAGSETLLLTLSGVAPLTLTSDTPSVIPSPGVISGYTYTIDAIDNSILADTNVLLTITDACADNFDAFIGVINQGGAGTIDLQPTIVAVGGPPDSISYTVINNGTANANNVTVWVDYGDSCNSACTPRTISVPAGGSINDSFSTSSITPTIYTIVVDPNNTVTESNESNNCIDSGSGGCSFPPSSCP